MSLPFYPASQPVLKSRKAQEEMLRRLKARRSGTEIAAKLLELRWTQRLAAFITFITSCLIVVTMGTGTLQIAVGKETLAFGAISLQHFVLVDVALIEQSQEHIMSNLSMVGSVSGGKQLEGDAQFSPAIHELSVVLICYFLGRGRFLFSTNGNRRSVLVAT